MQQHTQNISLDLLTTAKKLFIQHGIKNVSVEDICQDLGIELAVFYEYYESGDDLCCQLICQILDAQYDYYLSQLESEQSFDQKMAAVLQYHEQLTQNGLFRLIKSFKQSEIDNLYDIIDDKNATCADLMTKHLEAAQEEGLLRKDIKIDFITFMFFELSDILQEIPLRKIFPSSEKAWQQMIKYHFYGTVGRVPGLS